MRNLSRVVAATVVAAFLSTFGSGVHAGTVMDFSTDHDYLNPSPNSGWVVDRSSPAGFAATGGELVMTLKAPAPGSSFYNYQGMKYALPNMTGSQSLSIDMFIDPTWANANVGIWGVGYDDDAPSGVSAYPILAFRKSGTVAADIYTYDYMTTGAWMSTGASINMNGWNNLKAVLNVGTGIDYYVNGTMVGTSTADPNTDRFSAVILNGYNFDADQTIRFDNLAVSAVPVPAALPAGLALFGLVAAKRKFWKRQQA